MLETSADLVTRAPAAGATETSVDSGASAVVTLHDPVALDTVFRRFLRLRVSLETAPPYRGRLRLDRAGLVR